MRTSNSSDRPVKARSGAPGYGPSLPRAGAPTLGDGEGDGAGDGAGDGVEAEERPISAVTGISAGTMGRLSARGRYEAMVSRDRFHLVLPDQVGA